jgi:aconitate decarboxylase
LSDGIESEVMAGHLTRGISEFVVSFSDKKVPESATEMVVHAFTDFAANVIAARNEPVVRQLLAFVKASSAGQVVSSVLFDSGHRISAAGAALVNGTAGHALDYDDVAFGAHPSTVLIPAILAEGERLDASGMQCIRAYLVGYEVWGELWRREPDSYHLKGWHPTSVLGPVAAAASISFLRGLSTEQCTHALSFAASHAGGLVANFGSMVKPYQAGRAAASGIESVALAQAGLTGAPDSLEHSAGLLAALSPHGKADRLSPSRLGASWSAISQPLSFKKYPCCFATHRVIDAVLDMTASQKLTPADISNVQVTMRAAQASILKYHRPATALEAKFSMEFAVAATLIARQVGLRELTDEFVRREDVRSLVGKVTVVAHRADTRNPGRAVSQGDRVILVMRNGETLDSGDIAEVKSSENLERKFLDCCSRSPDIRAAQLYTSLRSLARLDSVRALAAAAGDGAPR